MPSYSKELQDPFISTDSIMSWELGSYSIPAGIPDLLVQASSVPRVPLYFHLPSHSVTSLCSPNSAENDIMWLSATAWRVMSLRLACCGWGLAVYVVL